MSGLPVPDEAAHEDGRLIHELTVVNGEISRYVFRFLDADAGWAEPTSIADERALGERLAGVAAWLCIRAERRQAYSGQTLAGAGATNNARQIPGNDTQAEQECVFTISQNKN